MVEKQTRAWSLALAVGWAATAAGPSIGLAADNLIPGKVGLVKPGKIAKGVFKGATPFTLDGDPTLGAASLSVFDTGGAGGSVTTALNQGEWKVLGGDTVKGYKYKGAGSGTDPCKVVLVKEKVIKFVCKGITSLTPPIGGELGVVLRTAGDASRYCGAFPSAGALKNDAEKGFKGKDAPAPGSCPVPAPVCGNNTVDAGESCDDGNTDNNDACPSDCIIDPCQLTATPQQVSINFAGPTPMPGGGFPNGYGGITILLDYPEGLINLPGNGTGASAAFTNEPPNASLTANDLGPNDNQHAVRVLVVSDDPISFTFNPGLLGRAGFTRCMSAAVPVPADFTCTVLDASDSAGNDLDPANITCSVTVP